jgi:hypothetical protein
MRWCPVPPNRPANLPPLGRPPTAKERSEYERFEKKQVEQLKMQAESDDRLMDKYKSEVAERYGLTAEQLSDIGTEGTIKNWPLPPMP